MKKMKMVLIIIFGVLLALIPFMAGIMPGTIITLLSVGGYLVFFLFVVKLLFSSKTLTRLIALPFLFLLSYLGFIIYKLKIYKLLLSHFGIETSVRFSVEVVEGIFELVFPYLFIGVFACALPAIIYSIMFAGKMSLTNKEKENILQIGIEKTATVIKVSNTNIKVNKVKVYEVTLELLDEYGQKYIAKKKVRIPFNYMSQILIGNKIKVLINPKDRYDFYIRNAHGII